MQRSDVFSWAANQQLWTRSKFYTQLTPHSERCLGFATHWNPGRYFFFLPTLLISYSVVGIRLPFCPQCPRKVLFGGSKIPILGGKNLHKNIFAPNAPKSQFWVSHEQNLYLGVKNAHFGGQKCPNLHTCFAPNASKRHLGSLMTKICKICTFGGSKQNGNKIYIAI